MSLVLEFSIFDFENELYLQKCGTAMGTKMAPTYANCFMGEVEETFMKSQHYKPFGYKRFLDDIFMIWLHVREKLETFINHFNNISPELRFTHEICTNSINFLDVTVIIDNNNNNNIWTTLFRKPTDSPQYLGFDSMHPQHSINAVPYAQAMRISRVCSTEESMHENLDNLRSRFAQCKFPAQIINDAIEKISTRAINSEQTDALQN